MSQPNRIDLREAFVRRQELLVAKLKITADFTKHPTTLGDASEADWNAMLRSFLPGRYEIGPIFAMDSTGQQSEQIDLAIYDRQYSPLWFEAGSSRIVPVESVYAVLEVKPEISAATLEYAAGKIASVRRLERRSAKIVDIKGTHDGPTPERRPILGGIVGLRSGWSGGLPSAAEKGLLSREAPVEHLDLGIALEHSAFDQVPSSANLDILEPGMTFSEDGTQLIFFAMKLFRRLQSLGTAMAVDLSTYDSFLERAPAESEGSY